ncbi:S-adenosyl-L-methionine-dependent methyltransferase [Pterulicium gracile]|uniref:Protein-lysine N-methyltransferase EFM4 n=1 Tax=Pterulicium gracile TaxID=1884261 RepID=A0A5C3QQ13_9AGAR|nr:S-adenosyl-L-methionine-dependent methyltransferase [Pterula gracilis]
MSAPEPSQKTRLPPSKLGTKQHWDDVYKREVQNFHDIQDEGEVWFPETVDKIVQWITDNVPSTSTSSVIEIGSGNGALLFSLAEEGFPAEHLFGVDYSEDAIRLAQDIARTRDLSTTVTFAVCDFLREDPEGRSSWDLILDKGTFDAMALLDLKDSALDPQAIYPAKVSRLLSSGGLFLITSCNFTEEELKSIFVTEQVSYFQTIKHRSFSFGGKTGSTYTSVVFKKE